VAVIYVPFLQAAFGTSPLSAMDWLVCIVVSSLVLWPMELVKLVERRRSRSP
jgi:Ca2+-transporting ATPase